MDIRLRDAEAKDGAALAAIYAPSILESAISFELEVPRPEEMASRVATIQQRYVWLVAEIDGPDGPEVVGYSYGGPFRPRAAYDWTVETAIYVRADHHGTGVGRRLYDQLFVRLADLGFRLAIAGATLPNDASAGFHRAFGFEDAGVFRNVGWKLGRWWDVAFWQKALGPGAAEAPDPR